VSSRYKILALSVILALIGILAIYSSTYQRESPDCQLIFSRQLIWLAIGLIFFFIFFNLNYRQLQDAAYFLYVGTLLLLLMVFLLGVVRLGAQRWLRFGWLNFQPSELTKLTMIIFMARYFSRKSGGSVWSFLSNRRIWHSFFLPFIFVILPVGLIIEQPDLGSAVLVFLIFIIMLLLSDVKLRYIISLFSLMLLSAPLAWRIMHDYQRERLFVFLNPYADPLGSGYTVIQSQIAIGSGGIFGKGWLGGTQSQLHFLPESHTDFIFATSAEQWGLLGCIIILLLYFFLIREGLLIALRTQERFGRLLAFGISIMLGIQVFINIAMNLGLAPVVGIPLPLMTYGGSSLLITFISLGILANIDKTRSIF